MNSVLLVEDDPVLGKGLQVVLGLEGYGVRVARGVREAAAAVRDGRPDLILLDLNLPDGDGLDFLKDLRDSGSRVPVLILTARTAEDSVVEGLRRGANDYVRKPFSNKELLARIETALRGMGVREGSLSFDRLVLRVDDRKALFDGKDLELKRREFDILRFLIERAGAVVTRETLLQQFDREGETSDRTIDSHVSHIRARLRQAEAKSVQITPVYGIGYRLESK